MKNKTNLDIFMSEILYMMKYRKIKMKDVMMEIYLRETGNETRCVEHMLKWYADIPRETFEVNAEMFAFLKAYVKDELVCDEAPLDYSVCTRVLIEIGVIPNKYSNWTLKDFIKIIRVKEN